jgi:hypothetical protein
VSERAVSVRPAVSHAVAERAVVGQCGRWEVRRHALSEPAVAGYVQGGYLHLQLWCARSGISILTPSRLTAGLFDLQLADGARVRAHLYQRIVDALPAAVRAPSESDVAALERWHVLPHEPAAHRAARTWRDDPRRGAPLPRRGAATP